MRSIRQLPAPLIYVISVGAEKGVSLLTLPVMAAYLAPSDYGAYDVAISFVEFVNLIMGLAIGATLIRFASTAPDDAGARLCARELTGTSLCLAIVLGTPIVMFGPWITSALGITAEPTALRILLAGAAVSALIELPLVWLRLKDRAWLFFFVVITRTAFQVVFLCLVLWLGHGAAGVMISNGIVLLATAAVLLSLQVRETGLSMSHRAIGQVLRYGLPIVGASLCMYALGNFNKLFLTGVVPDETIAHFALASRIALIVGLALVPFDLWWAPKRISTLSEPGGYKLGARMWAYGIAILIIAGLGVALGGPVIVELLLPQTYAPVSGFLVPMILLQIIHNATGLTNVGNFARERGTHIFAIEATSAALAVAGYVLLIPPLGITGVIVSMAGAQFVRFGLHLWFGEKLAPLPYPWVAVALSLLAGAGLGLLAPGTDTMILHLLYSVFAVIALAAVFVAVGLVTLPNTLVRRFAS